MNLLFNVSNAMRLFPGKAIKKVVELWKVVCVVIAGQRPRFVSKKQFLDAFVQFRKLGAKKLEVCRDAISGSGFIVKNPANSSLHFVELTNAGPKCNCNDYINQIELFGKGCCKHGYAVLNYLGFESLKEYVNYQIWAEEMEERQEWPHLAYSQY